jgi:hypothetical protein
MTTVELLAYCRAREREPCIPDLIWQREVRRDDNLRFLCEYDVALTPNNGYHDMYDFILENRSCLLTTGRPYATVLFTENPACSKPQI